MMVLGFACVKKAAKKKKTQIVIVQRLCCTPGCLGSVVVETVSDWFSASQFASGNSSASVLIRLVDNGEKRAER